MNKAILTKEVAEKILNSQILGHFEFLISLDLGISKEKVFFDSNCVVLRGAKVSLNALKKLKENKTYVLEGEDFKAVEFFSSNTNLVYKLKPTKDWPALTLSSVPMHRFKHFSPKEDTLSKINEITPIFGNILDTCCGLGYTSIMAANSSKKVEEVIVFEKDENVLRVAEYNPYSQGLFTNPKIKLHLEDAFIGIKKLPSNYFDRIIHDPPTPSFAPDLYFPQFYDELFRVAKQGAKIYHYCPNPGKTKGKEFWPQVKARLETAGFTKIKYHKKSSGISCKK